MQGATARTTEECFRNTLLSQELSYPNVYEEKEVVVNPDYIRFLPQMTDLNNFIRSTSFSEFLEQFESDLNIIKTFMANSNILSQGDNIPRFNTFIKDILKLDTSKKTNPNYNDKFLSYIYSSLRDSINVFSQLLLNPRINNDIKEIKILSIIDGIHLCIPGTIDRVQLAITNLRLCSTSVLGELKQLKNDRVLAIVLQYLHNDFGRAGRRWAGLEVHGVATLINLIASEYDMIKLEDDIYAQNFTSDLHDEIKDELKNVIDKNLSVQEIIRTFVDNEDIKLTNIFNAEQIDFKKSKLIPLSMITPSLNENIVNNFIEERNAKRINKSELNILTLRKLIEVKVERDGTETYDFSRFRELYTRWLCENILYGCPPDLIIETGEPDGCKILSYINSCYWIEKDQKERALTLKYLSKIDLEFLTDNVTVQLLDQALSNKNSDSDHFIFFTCDNIYKLLKNANQSRIEKICTVFDALVGSVVHKDIISEITNKVYKGDIKAGELVNFKSSISFGYIIRSINELYPYLDIKKQVLNELDLDTLPCSIIKLFVSNTKEYRKTCKRSVQKILELPSLLLNNCIELVDEGFGLNEYDATGNNFIMHAIKQDNERVYNILINNKDINPYHRNKFLDDIFILSIKYLKYNYSLDILKMFDFKKIINRSDKNGNTALHYLCSCVFLTVPQKSLITLMSDCGCDMTIKNKSNNTAVDVVLSWANFDVLEILLQNKKIDIKEQFFRHKKSRFINFLSRRFCDELQINNQVKIIKTLLKNPIVIENLLKVKNIYILNKVLLSDNVELFKLIISKPYVDINEVDEQGKSILFYIVKEKKNQLLELILKDPGLEIHKALLDNQEISGLLVKDGFQEQNIKIKNHMEKSKIKNELN